MVMVLKPVVSDTVRVIYKDAQKMFECNIHMAVFFFKSDFIMCLKDRLLYHKLLL
jgi:hypothetical protein